MKSYKYSGVLLLIVTTHTFSADWAVYPDKKEYVTARNQTEIMIRGLKQRSMCMAAIMTMMSYEHEDISSRQINPTSAIVTRYRRDDRTKWNWLCKVDNNRIVYAAMNIDGPNKIKIGRWRIHPADEKITFKIDDTNLTIAISYDESNSTRRTYSLKAIRSWK